MPTHAGRAEGRLEGICVCFVFHLIGAAWWVHGTSTPVLYRKNITLQKCSKARERRRHPVTDRLCQLARGGGDAAPTAASRRDLSLPAWHGHGQLARDAAPPGNRPPCTCFLSEPHPPEPWPGSFPTSCYQGPSSGYRFAVSGFFKRPASAVETEVPARKARALPPGTRSPAREPGEL